MALSISGGLQDNPIFICGAHRSRSTYLQRLLNIHPGLVIWGEHGGLINKLAEIDQIGRWQDHARNAPTEQDIDGLRAKRLDVLLDFNPWLNPLQPAALHDHHRRMMSGVFRRGLAPDQRWGVKEIRYSAPSTTAFMAELYPRGQFLILRRDLVELCVSNILAGWSADRLRGMGAGHTTASAQAVLADCVYALCVIDDQLERSRNQLGRQALEVPAADISGAMPAVFDFLGVAPPDGFAETAALISLYQLGPTPKDRPVGLLSEAYIRDAAPALIAQAKAKIAGEGADQVRLRDQAGYSFLVGDHDLQGTGLSSVF